MGNANLYFAVICAAGAIFLFAHEIMALIMRFQESMNYDRGATPTDMHDPAQVIGLLPGDLLRIKAVTASILGVVGLSMVFMTLSNAKTFGFVIALVALLLFFVIMYVSFAIPDAILRMLYERRIRGMNRQLVDAMSVLSLALRSGKTFEAALPIVAEEIPGQLGAEFNRAVQEISVGGLALDKSLTRLAERLPFKDMQIFVSSMLIVHTIGGSQAEILDRSSQLIRERFLILEKCKSLTAEGRFTAVAISLAPLFVLIVNLIINNTMAAQFITHPIGILILTGITISDFIGYKILTHITKSDF